MNLYREDNPCCCYFHPKEVIVGVCPLCLNERLLILAAKQGHHSLAKGHHRTHSLMHKKPPINLPKIFALGSFLTRLEFRHWKSDHSDHDASTSQEGMYCGVVVVVIVSSSSESPFSYSFISIKFEDNGVASWEKTTATKVPLQHCTNMPLSKEAKGTKSVVEHAKPRATLRWRKRIGHLFQLIRWKRSTKANVCHVGSKVEGVKVMRKGWIRTLTKRKTKE
ncbi:hypothetical protein CK203_071692 [Vitis vinifera]|uniref:Uncharacterized protein n=1 Tax=Vitis vinifera TaxID=29760 RepID=A0A438C377_VITVI|nr:hypothetical protein CK203_071692 [Vitis vinifera]